MILRILFSQLFLNRSYLKLSLWVALSSPGLLLVWEVLSPDWISSSFRVDRKFLFLPGKFSVNLWFYRVGWDLWGCLHVWKLSLSMGTHWWTTGILGHSGIKTFRRDKKQKLSFLRCESQARSWQGLSSPGTGVVSQHTALCWQPPKWGIFLHFNLKPLRTDGGHV